jgi:oligopeptide/dipeptide ABC transporter ATP-binding protein
VNTPQSDRIPSNGPGTGPTPVPDRSALLSIRHLRVEAVPPRAWSGKNLPPQALVDDFHIDMREREVVAVVGDAESGRDALARALAGLETLKFGSVRYRGEEVALGQEQPATKIARKPINTLAAIAGITLIAPQPFARLPKKQRQLSAVAWLSEALAAVMPKESEEGRNHQLSRLLGRVGLIAADLHHPLHQYDSDVAARLCLARSLLTPLRLLICDEPVSEYDAAPFAALVKSLQAELGFALIYCTPNIELVRGFAPRVLSLYRGRVIETAPAKDFFERPRHPYLRIRLGDAALIEAIGQREPQEPAPVGPTMGCNFHPNCPLADPMCVRAVPSLRKVGKDHYAACHFVAAEVDRFG